MSSLSRTKLLEELVLTSFLIEVNALKPGNVHRYAAGHNMSINDFEKSAELTSPILCQHDLSVGERIYRAVEVTMQQVGCNTNLGMLLLFAPLVAAVEERQAGTRLGLRQRLSIVLSSLNDQDARCIFQAIRLANPGGLGESERYDVKGMPEISVQAAMEEARNRDRIALQYVSGFEDIFSYGLVWIKDYTQRWNQVEWAAVLCYLNLLSRFCDSHVVRKHGEKRAEEIRMNSEGIAARFAGQEQPERMKRQLLQYDTQLKSTGINPGTTADLTATSILAYYLKKNDL